MEDPAKRATGQLGEYATTNSRPERSTGEIMRDIMGNAQEIIRSEIRLAKVELRDEAKKAGQAGAMFGAALVIGLFGLGFLLWAAVFGIGVAIPMWLSSLIIGFFLVCVAGAAAAAGKARWATVPSPDRTIGEMKENAQWLKHPTKS
jgi:uncharacterized membrane protein YqjE